MKKIILIAVLLALVGYVAYQALMYYDNEFIYGRMRETPAIRPYEEPLLIMEAGIVPFSGGEMNFKAEIPEKIKSPLNLKDPANIKSGQNVYQTYCAQCHGNNHDGNGPVGQSFYPLPTDFRIAKVQSQKEGYLFYDISYGSPNGRQPALATTVSTTERWQVIAFIKSLGLR
jgi:mono/diheme cytochrome c family protein